MYDNILYGRGELPQEGRHQSLRPRIEKLLDRATGRPLVLITAGAGFGKSLSLSYYIRNTGTRHIWMRLSELDNYSERFWENFVYSAGGDAFGNMRFPNTAATTHAFLQTLAGMVGDRFILVLDNFHLITEPSVLQLVENLVAARMNNLSIIITGRAAPALNLQGLDAAGDVFHITGDDLIFSVAEIAEYLRQQDVTVSDADARAIHGHTGGWGAAVALSALSYKNREVADGNLPDIRARLLELVENEVFSTFSETARQSLVRLSLYERIPSDVMAAYPDLRSEVGLGNFFLRYNPSTSTYDIHSILQCFLKTRRDELPPEELCSAHIALAERYRAGGFDIDALRHYRECSQHDKIWEIIAGYDIAMSVDTANLFQQLIDEFPIEFSQKHNLIPVVYARLMLNNGQRHVAEERFLRMVEAFEATGEHPEQAGECYLFLGLISLLEPDDRFVDYFKKAAACLPDGSKLIDSRLGFADGNYMLMTGDPSPGSVTRHVNMVTDIMPLATRTMNGAGDGIEFVTRAEAAYYRGDLKDAETAAYRAIYQAGRNSHLDTVCAAYFVLLRTYFGTGSYAKAAACMDELRTRTADVAGSGRYIHSRDIMSGWYYSRLGDNQRLPKWITGQSDNNKALSPNSLSREPLIRAYNLLSKMNYLELSAYLDTLEQSYGIRKLLIAQIEVQIFKSIAAHKLGNAAGTVRALTAAYELACGNELYMPFIEMGKHTRSVIYAAQHEQDMTIPVQWLETMYSKAAAYEKQLRSIKMQHHQKHGYTADALDTLTHREKEILRRLCQGLTSEETAGQMYISTSAVKKALTGIYNKLGAANRADAVRIATESDILATV